MFRMTIALLLALIGSGCANSYKLTRTDETKPSRVLSREGAVYIAVPVNGQYEGAEYRTSGALTAEAMVAAFSTYASRVEQNQSVENFDAAIARSRNGGFMYFVEPTILHWEDRNTEWSGRPDVVSIKVAVYEVSSRQLIDSATIDGKSKWATLGGDHPQHLLKQPLSTYIAQLYGAPAPTPATAPQSHD